MPIRTRNRTRKLLPDFLSDLPSILTGYREFLVFSRSCGLRKSNRHSGALELQTKTPRRITSSRILISKLSSILMDLITAEEPPRRSVCPNQKPGYFGILRLIRNSTPSTAKRRSANRRETFRHFESVAQFKRRFMQWQRHKGRFPRPTTTSGQSSHCDVKR